MILRDRGYLEDKDIGSVSFAALSVIMLLLAILAGAYMASVSRMGYETKIRAGEIGRLEELKEKAIAELKLQARYFAYDSVFEYIEGSEKDINELLNEKFTAFMEKRSAEWWSHGHNLVELRSPWKDHYYINITEKSYRTDDIVPNVGTFGMDLYNNPSNSLGGEFGMTNKTTYYILTGEFDFELTNTYRENSVFKTTGFELIIDSPYPFMLNKMSSFESSIHGESSELGRMVKYMLTVIAQYRVMMGYGMEKIVDGPDYAGVTSDGRPMDDIITREDVEIALNLAMLLLVSKHYRTMDPEAVEILSENTDGELLEELINSYVVHGVVDAADLIALYRRYGYDNSAVFEDEVASMDLVAIASQTLYSVIDQYTLHYLDYFNLMPMEPDIYRPYKNISQIYDGGTIIDWFVGNTGYSGRGLVTDWVRYTFERAGLTDTNLVRPYGDQWPFNEIDSEPSEDYDAEDDWNPIQDYPRTPDPFILSYDMQYVIQQTNPYNQWWRVSCGCRCHSDTPHRYNLGHVCVHYYTIDDVTYTRRYRDRHVANDFRIFDITATIEAPNHVIPFEMVDIISENPGLWNEFFDTYSSRVEGTKDGLRSAVEGIILRYTETVMYEIEKILIHPYDEYSVLNDIQRNVDIAVSNVATHFEQNPHELADIVHESLYTEHQPLVQALKEFIQENYNDLVRREALISRTIDRLVDHLIDLNPSEHPNNPHIHFSIEEGDRYRGRINGPNDKTIGKTATVNDISDRDALNIFIYGGVRTSSQISKLRSDLRPHVEAAFDLIREREIKEEDTSDSWSDKDGVLIQALDNYQYSGREIYGVMGPVHTPLETSIREINSFSTDKISVEENGFNEAHIDSKEYVSIETNEVEISNIDTKEEYTQDSFLEYEQCQTLDHKTTVNIYSVTDSEKEYAPITQITNLKQLTINEHVPPTADFTWAPNNPNVDQTVFFSDLSEEGNASITSWHWQFGDGITSNLDNPTHSYSQGGRSFNVVLTVTDQNGLSDSRTRSIYVNGPPTADFTWTPSTPNEGQSVSFSDRTQEGDASITSWHWQFGDGSTSTLRNPSKTYSDWGWYQVRLTVTDGNGLSDSITRSIYINAKPIADFTWTPTNPVEDDSIRFDASDSYDPDGTIVSYTWDFGDGNTGSGEIVHHTYSDIPGSGIITYQVRLTVEDDNYDNVAKDDIIKSVTVDIRPYVISFTPHGGDVDTCTPIEITFSEPIDVGSFDFDFDGPVFNGPDFDEFFNVVWNDDKDVVTLYPEGYYRRDGLHTFTLDESITDKSTGTGTNAPIKGELTYSFQTRDYPMVIDYVPQNDDDRFNLTNDLGYVKLGATISLRFDEDMHTYADAYGILIVRDKSTGEELDLGWSFYWNHDDGSTNGLVLVLNHTGFFNDNTEYEVTIKLQNILSNKRDLGFPENAPASEDGKHGTSGIEFTWTFTTEDTIPPYIVETNPEPGEDGVELDERIRVEFNEPIDPGTFEYDIYPPISSNINWINDRVVDIIPNEHLSEFTTYTIWVNCADISGNELDSNPEWPNPWQFTTLDETPPEIISISPVDGATNVRTDTPIYVTFSKSVVQNSISWSIQPSVGLTVSWDGTSTIAVLRGNFAPGQTYTFTVHDVMDTYGNTLLEPVSVEFTTSPHGTGIEPLLFPDIVQSITGADNPEMPVPLIPLMNFYMANVTRYMVESTHFSNTEYRIPVDISGPEFHFWLNDTNDPIATGDPFIKEMFEVKQDPIYLSLGDGEYSIDLEGGAHYANVLRHTSRAYETHWTVSVDKEIEMSTYSDRRIYLKDGTHHPTWLNRTMDVGFSIRIPVYTAWHLQDVDYHIEGDTLPLLTDVIDYLWNPSMAPLSVTQDVGEKLLPLMDDFEDALKSYDIDRIMRIEHVLSEAISSDNSVLKQRVSNVAIHSGLNDYLLLSGMHVLVDTNRMGVLLPNDGGSRTILASMTILPEDTDGAHFYNSYLLLDNRNIISIGDGRIGNLDLQWQIDPYNTVYPSEFNIQGTNIDPYGDDWVLDMKAPLVRHTQLIEMRVGDYTDINQHSFTVGNKRVDNLDIGIRILHHEGDVSTAVIEGEIWQIFEQTYHQLIDHYYVDDYFIEIFLRTVMMKLEDRIIDLMSHSIEEISFFVEMNINDGCRSALSFTLRSGDNIPSFFYWTSRNVDKYLHNMLRNYMDSSPNVLHLPIEMMGNTFVEFRIGESKEGFIGGNLPAFSQIVRGEATWTIRFGVNESDTSHIYGYIEGI